MSRKMRCEVGMLLPRLAPERGSAVLIASHPTVLAVADRAVGLQNGALGGLCDPERTTLVYRHSA